MSTNHTNFTIINNNLKYVTILNQLLHSSHKYMSSILAIVLYNLFNSRDKGGYTLPTNYLFWKQRQSTALNVLRDFGLINLDYHYKDMNSEIVKYNLTNAGHIFLSKFVRPYIDKQPQRSRRILEGIASVILFVAILIIALIADCTFKMIHVESSPTSLSISKFREANSLMNDIGNCMYALIPIGIVGIILVALSRSTISIGHKALNDMTDNITELDVLKFLIKYKLIKRNLSRISSQTITALSKSLFTEDKDRDAWIQ